MSLDALEWCKNRLLLILAAEKRATKSWKTATAALYRFAKADSPFPRHLKLYCLREIIYAVSGLPDSDAKDAGTKEGNFSQTTYRLVL